MQALRVSQKLPDESEHVVDVAIVGAGAAGLVCALAASQQHARVMLFERDRSPSGSTALSAGLIPAAPTRWQAAQGVDDSVTCFVEDILSKSNCPQDRALVTRLVEQSAQTVHWLSDSVGVPLSLVEGFTYPGHSQRRMHGTPSRTGQALMASLLAATENSQIDLVTQARVFELFECDGVLTGIGLQRNDGEIETIGARSVVLACNGYGGNPELLERYIPSMRDALYFGHAGNTGDAVIWAEQLGLKTRHLGAWQGHGSVAAPHGILISWAVMMEGGIQVNLDGLRFSNEHDGYSEQAQRVLAQPGSVAWNIFDQRIADIASQFDDFREAESAGAIIRAPTLHELAAKTKLSPTQLDQTVAQLQELAQSNQCDQWGRRFDQQKLLRAPWFAVRVEGALFHTQGGVQTGLDARAVKKDGSVHSNLFAVGGAAAGISGSGDSGYLSGNGLLTAVTLGQIAGREAAALRHR